MSTVPSSPSQRDLEPDDPTQAEPAFRPNPGDPGPPIPPPTEPVDPRIDPALPDSEPPPPGI